MSETGYAGTATYCPEDNKLRLYVGRVPRDEYEKLRADGWVSTPKQTCDFVATWTPSRRDTALEYAGIIEDEDMEPAERSADRAERFVGYREKRTVDATGHADKYDAGPSAHGFQSAARAERAAARHNRIADRSCDAWGKAEYWQRRTAGVIRHALHKSTPGVRMGRIKVIEADLRKHVAALEKYTAIFKAWQAVAALTDKDEQTRVAKILAGDAQVWADYKHPRAENLTGYYKDNEVSLYSLLTHSIDPITGAEAVAFYFSNHNEPAQDDDWSTHYKLRLAYENQMIEAQGGRAAFVEMVPGGWIGKRQIRKVNKSPATGRVVSVTLKIPGDRWGNSNEGFHLRAFNIERLSVDAYRTPTAEDIESLKNTKDAEKATAPKKAACPLINPTDTDAERLQALLNKNHPKNYDDQPRAVERITQAVYSKNSSGTYAKCETVEITGGGFLMSNNYMSERPSNFPAVAKVRLHGRRVIIISDKPQKPFPGAVWKDPRPALLARCIDHSGEIRTALRCNMSSDWTKAQRELIDDAHSIGLVYWSSLSQFNLTAEGHATLNQQVNA